jgi:hypothetical protein
LYTPLLSPIRALCPAHLTLLDFITWTILGEVGRSLNSSLCSLLHYPVTLSPHIFSSLPYSQTPSAYNLLQCEWPSFTPIKNNRKNYISVYLKLCIFG